MAIHGGFDGQVTSPSPDFGPFWPTKLSFFSILFDLLFRVSFVRLSYFFVSWVLFVERKDT